jgi:hypothetical protein
MWRESKVRQCMYELTIDECMDLMQHGQVVQIVAPTVSNFAYHIARLGEAWKFRRTFERGSALVKAQDAWCLKAQAAASTGKLSLLEGQDFPSEIELDVIVGMRYMWNY